ncbi:MAG: RecQ family ATP-dependent DNA helicase [Bacteroidaceae bacterium]|nr:RecQ family ATP-dependent DNA helicase [Bacteroidaceae bacterium]
MSYLDILRQYWGYESFRGIQSDIIESAGSGHDTLGLMPTGGGKSITFQVTALAKEGVCLVITPLIALMKDQVLNLRRHGIRAAAIYSGMKREEIVETLEDCIFGGCKFLYVSPERLASELFMTKLQHMKVCLITVDEAHCISQWGYDFRPAYLNIAAVRKCLPGVTVLALTATATPKVAEDIQEKLGFSEKRLFRMSFDRENLWYIVRKTDNKTAELSNILSKTCGSAIVYVRNRKETKEIADDLGASGITSGFFHAGLDPLIKDQRQKEWTSGKFRVMVATNAFGMGIDKPDVRVVAHMDMPDSPEEYFQEAGRAGRDGKRAYAVLLQSPGDKRVLSKRVSDSFPDKDFIRKVYDKLAYLHTMAIGDGRGCTFDFSLSDFCRQYSLPAVQTDSALRILTRMGYIEYIEETDYSARLRFTARRDELYDLRSENPVTEKIIGTILRTYSGIFTEEAFIDEQMICHKSGTDRNTLYTTLSGLDRMGTVRYVPPRRTPMIVWSRERVDSEMLRFTPEVYELRKREYKERIKAMTEYASRTNGCRNAMLLNYFGERRVKPCMHCDLCMERHESGITRGMFQSIRSDIIAILKENQGIPRPIFNLPYQEKYIETVLEFMSAEEEILLKDGCIYYNDNYPHDDN